MAEKFVLMEKDGERIQVHPLMVEEHERLMWRKVGGEARPAFPAPASSTGEDELPSLKERRSVYVAELKAMTVAEVRELAVKNGVAGAETLPAKQLLSQLLNLWNQENPE